MILSFIKRMLFGKPKSEIAVPDHEVWFDHNIRLWVSQFKDAEGNQIGSAGYGNTQAQAVEDVFYQNIDILE